MINEDENGDKNIVLIDFGLSEKIKSTKDDKNTTDEFSGNVMFSSPEQMDFKKTTKKDDLISLCYLMFYLLNG